MRIKERKHHRSGPGGVVLLTTGLMIGLLLVTPAGAHVTDKINHIVKHVRNAVLPITSKELGDIRTESAFVTVDGGVGQNSQYNQEEVSVFCDAGETAISWTAGWGFGVEGGPGDIDDLEVNLSSAAFLVDADGNEGFRVTGGNDSGSENNLVLQVRCLQR